MPRTKRRLPSGTLNARNADKYALYLQAVQSPEHEIDFIDRVFRRLKGRTPTTLREDFCGTGSLACCWAARRSQNRSVGIDISPGPLKWGEARHRKPLGKAANRVRLLRGNVLNPPLAPGGPRHFDAVAAFNFSYWTFHQRRVMLDYFREARSGLVRDGLLFLDLMGGPETQSLITDRTPCRLARKDAPEGTGYGPFTYLWEHAAYDPITGATTCHIHFAFPDGSKLNRAFTYRWRVWSIPELRDILLEAGFSRVRLFWEGDNSRGGGNGVFREQARGTPDASYIGYVVAER